jgi:hypothetical protein
MLIAPGLLMMSSIAGAQEQKAPGTGDQKQQAPTPKMTGEDVTGHMGQCKRGRGMHRGMMHQGIYA